MTSSQSGTMVPPQEVFQLFASAFQNRSSGILKLKSKTQALRQFVFSAQGCVDVLTNVKDELPGTFLLKKKVISETEYKEYLKKCAATKTSAWGLANPEKKMSPEELLDIRRQHVQDILSNLKLNQFVSATFHSATGIAQTDTLIEPLRLLMVVASKFSQKEILAFRPELAAEETRISMQKDLPVDLLSEDQQGLFTVIEHNDNLGDILESSFLDNEVIYQSILAFSSTGYIRAESASESEKRQFLENLTDEQKKERQILKNILQKLTNANLYECLGIETDSDQEDVQKGFETQNQKFADQKFHGLFFRKEEDAVPLIRERIKKAHAILSNPEKKIEYDLFLQKGDTGSFLDQSQTIQEEKIIQELNKMVADGKFSESIDLALEKIKALPNFVKLYRFLIDLVQNTKKTGDEELNQKIFARFKEGISKNPRNAPLFTLLGEWCLAIAQKNNAFKAFQKAIHLNPGSSKLRKYILDIEPRSGREVVIEALIQNLQNLNHFEFMGLDPNSSMKDVRSAYHNASRSFHPDLFHSEKNQKIKEKSKRVFKEIVASYMVLRDEEKRKAYVESLFSSTRKKEEKKKTMVPKSVQARKYYEEALKFLKADNLSSAKLNLQLALSYESDNYLLQKMLKDVDSKLQVGPTV